MAGEKTPQRMYAFGMFLAVSVLSGLLLAGLAFPFASMAGTAAKVASDSVDDLPADLEAPPPSARSQVLLADGSVLAEFYNENRIYVPLAKISKSMQQAQIAVEDQDFYQHGALNLEATLRQLVRNSRSGEVTGGGSTLTQQYVKLLLIEKATQAGDEEAARKAQEQSIERKIRELRYAIALEKKLSKQQILEGYLNLAYYGAGAYGVEAAAKRYFNTTAETLTVAQSAMLAGLVQSPSTTDPLVSTQAAINRREFVLGQMKREEYITEAQEKEALATPFDKSQVQPLKEGCFSSRYPHICTYVKQELLSDKMKVLGATKEDRLNLLNRGGLIIRTPIDPKVQDAAQAAIFTKVKPTDPVIATSTLIQPKTGLIVAMAQSKPRQGAPPAASWQNFVVGNSMGGSDGFWGGSTFKPFIIAAAMEKGYPASKTYNAPNKMDFGTTEFQVCNGTYRATGPWEVSNGGYNYGNIDMVKATSSSVNTYFVQLLADVGVCDTAKMATRLGLKIGSGASLLEGEPQRATFGLGQVQITPISLTEAYATFANRGVRCEPRILESITTHDGKPITVPGAKCEKVLDPQIADAVTKLLTGPMISGTARGFALPRSYSQAGKTGTGAGALALAFAGFTPELAGTTFIGIDTKDRFWTGRTKTLDRVQLPGGTFIRGFGSDTGEIWRTSMLAGLEGKPKSKFVGPLSKYIIGERIQVPSVAGLSISQAKARLEAAGFTTTVQQVFSEYPAGVFLGITPSGRAPRYSTIALRVSKGEDPAVVEARRRADEEARRKAEEEMRKKAEEERKKKTPPVHPPPR